MRDETRRAVESLALALVVGVLHLAWLSGRFEHELGRGGVLMLVGCTFTTCVLWVMLSMRTLSADGAFAPELDDGLTAMASTAWLVALLPPRAENYLAENAVDDFAWVYLPVALLAVFSMLAVRAVWKARTVPMVLVRLVATSVPGFVAVAGLITFVAKGDGAGQVAVRALGLAGASAVLTAVLARRNVRAE